jgi:predicted AAA+ superfamily ATPase
MKKIIDRRSYLQAIRESRKEKITLLLWPRRAWKTFLMKQLYNEYSDTSLYLTFDDQAIKKQFTTKDEFLAYLNSKIWNKKVKYIYLDEIQLVPWISRLLKQWYDETDFRWESRPEIVASWSGSYQIFKQIEDSMVWRIRTIHIYPLSFAEYLSYYEIDIQTRKENWNQSMYSNYETILEEYSKFGGYPEVVLAWTYEEKVQILKMIVQSWFEKDIKLLFQWNDWLNFQKLFEYLWSRVTSILRPHQVAKDLWFSGYLIKKYLTVAVKSFMIHALWPLTTDPKKEIKQWTKYYFTDCGVLNYILGNFSVLERGDLIENIVVDSRKRRTPDWTYYWKIRSWSEIDLVQKDVLTNTYHIAEIKAWVSDTFPKVFSSFAQVYQVNTMTLYNKSLSLKRKNSAWEEVTVTPYFLSGK